MTFCETSITLDDVSCLFHLPIMGVFWTPQDVIEEIVVELYVDYLGVARSEATPHVHTYRGAYYKLEWFHDLFTRH